MLGVETGRTCPSRPGDGRYLRKLNGRFLEPCAAGTNFRYGSIAPLRGMQEKLVGERRPCSASTTKTRLAMPNKACNKPKRADGACNRAMLAAENDK
jgi:hypothetical protein